VQLIWLTLLITVASIVIALTAKTARELILVLQLVGLNSLLYAAILAAAFAF
jgi:1,4-dihydroxy-2-naphthoate octaprenyltransferase